MNTPISDTFRQQLQAMRADVLAHKPKAMVLLAGTNDISGNTGPMTLEQIQGNIETMAELCTVHGIKVVLSSILPVSNYHAKPEDWRGPQTFLLTASWAFSSMASSERSRSRAAAPGSALACWGAVIWRSKATSLRGCYWGTTTSSNRSSWSGSFPRHRSRLRRRERFFRGYRYGGRLGMKPWRDRAKVLQRTPAVYPPRRVAFQKRCRERPLWRSGA